MARRKGRVARLPKEIREQVSIQLQDGIAYAKIGEWLAERGHAGINEEDIGAWYKGGHGEWLEAQEKLSEVQSKQEAARQLTERTEPGVFDAANSELASSQVFEGLNGYRPEMLVEAINADPELYVRLLNTFIRLSRETQSRRKAQLRLAQLKANEKEGNSGPRELSAETIRKMQELLGWVAKEEPEQPEPGKAGGTDGANATDGAGGKA